MIRKKILISFLMTFSVMFIFSSVFAEPGDLKINNQVIYRQNKAENKNSSGEFNLPDLFLEKKTSQENLLKEKTEKTINNIETNLFLEETPDEEALNTKVLPILFRNADGFSYIEENENNLNQSNLKSVGIILIIFFGAILFLGVGIFFGKKFSHVFK